MSTSINSLTSTVTAAVAPLFEPITLGALQLKNRILFAPTTRNRGNIPNDSNAKYYADRATAGAIISEATLVTPQGYEWSNAPGIHNRAQIAGWRLVTDAVHAAGGIIVNQINDIGRVAHPLLQAGQPALGPSAIAARGGQFKQIAPYSWVDGTGIVHDYDARAKYTTPQAIEDPWTHVQLFRTAFENSKKAGFDGVELHGANGYLVHQFLDSSSNQRTDEWGGDAQRRTKFAIEVIKQAIDVWGADRVGIKLSPEGGYNDMGMPLDETLATYGYLLSQLSSLDIAYVHIQRWIAPFDPESRGTQIPNSTWRKLYTGNLLLNGAYTAVEGASAINQGIADAILFGRDWIANPDLIQRIQHHLPLNSFDWTTASTTTSQGYTDYPKWDDMTQEQQQAAYQQRRELEQQHLTTTTSN